MLDYAKLCEEQHVSKRDQESGRLVRRCDPRSERIGLMIFVGIPILLGLTFIVLAFWFAGHPLHLFRTAGR